MVCSFLNLYTWKLQVDIPILNLWAYSVRKLMVKNMNNKKETEKKERKKKVKIRKESEIYLCNQLSRILNRTPRNTLQLRLPIRLAPLHPRIQPFRRLDTQRIVSLRDNLVNLLGA